MTIPVGVNQYNIRHVFSFAIHVDMPPKQLNKYYIYICPMYICLCRGEVPVKLPCELVYGNLYITKCICLIQLVFVDLTTTISNALLWLQGLYGAALDQLIFYIFDMPYLPKMPHVSL